MFAKVFPVAVPLEYGSAQLKLAGFRVLWLSSETPEGNFQWKEMLSNLQVGTLQLFPKSFKEKLFRLFGMCRGRPHNVEI